MGNLYSNTSQTSDIQTRGNKQGLVENLVENIAHVTMDVVETVVDTTISAVETTVETVVDVTEAVVEGTMKAAHAGLSHTVIVYVEYRMKGEKKTHMICMDVVIPITDDENALVVVNPRNADAINAFKNANAEHRIAEIKSVTFKLCPMHSTHPYHMNPVVVSRAYKTVIETLGTTSVEMELRKTHLFLIGFGAATPAIFPNAVSSLTGLGLEIPYVTYKMAEATTENAVAMTWNGTMWVLSPIPLLTVFPEY